MHTSQYVGRFAPSPSGALHMGSLVCALASYLDARYNGGRWLLRIEDIDPPREQAGASVAIVQTLAAHQLLWDGQILFQNSRSEAYRASLADIHARGLSYFCTCSRKRLASLAHRYDGHCRAQTSPPKQAASIKLNLAKTARYVDHSLETIAVNDRIQGRHVLPLESEGDFVIHRKDQLFAYQLAVVTDDIAQNITDIVRGIDLFDSLSKQVCLTKLLHGSDINYAHIPVLIDNQGLKLSKQNRAQAIADESARENLFLALRYLQQNPPAELAYESIQTIIDWGIQHWNIEKLKQLCVINQF